MIRARNTSKQLSVEEQLSLLLSEEGKKAVCDDTTTVVIDAEELPSWFDEAKFKRGQAYYQENMFAMFVAKLCGLISILSVPSILNILVFTRMSNTCLTAYRRYVATIFHVNIWYDNDFYPGSKSWQSMMAVRKLHCIASRRACTAGFGSINQKDMALTQFGFIGYALIRPHLLGLHNNKPEDVEGFVHFWRVMGWLLGIDDRFNICRESVSETKEICEGMIEHYFAFGIRSTEPTFLCMSAALLQGMWYVNPFVSMDTFFAFIFRLTHPDQSTLSNSNNNGDEPNGNIKNEGIKMKNNNNSINCDLYKEHPMNWRNRFLFTYLVFILEVLLKYKLFRMYYNSQMRLAMFLLQYFPFLAYYSFGITASRINILNVKVSPI